MARMRISRLEVLTVVVVLGLAAYVFVPIVRAGRAEAMQAACAGQLASIGRALGEYLDANGDRWPFVDKLRRVSRHDPRWPVLPDVLSPYLSDRSLYHCPADTREIENEALQKEFGSRSTWFETEGLSYEWLWPDAYGGRRVGDEDLTPLSGRGKGRADQDLLSEFGSFHEGAGRVNILYADFIVRPAEDAWTAEE